MPLDFKSLRVNERFRRLLLSSEPEAVVAFGDPADWTLIEKWTAADLSDMVSGMEDLAFMNGFAWSYDGLNFTLANGGSQDLYTFPCSVAFDPSTSGTTPTVVRISSGPSSVMWNDDGTMMYYMRQGHNFFVNFPCPTPWVISNEAENSQVTKANVGFTGSAESNFAMNVDESEFIYEGQTDFDEQVKLVTFTGQDLTTYNVQATKGINPPIVAVSHNTGLSNLSLDGGSYYQVDTGGIYKATMSDPGDLSTLTHGSLIDLNTDLSLGFVITRVWINPNSTGEVWVGALNLSMARLATNI